MLLMEGLADEVRTLLGFGVGVACVGLTVGERESLQRPVEDTGCLHCG